MTESLRRKLKEVVRKAMEKARAQQVHHERERQPAASLGLALAAASKLKRKRDYDRAAAAKATVIEIQVPRVPGSVDEISMKVINDLKRVKMEARPENFQWLYHWYDTEDGQRLKKVAAESALDTPPKEEGAKWVFFSRADGAWFCRGPLSR